MVERGIARVYRSVRSRQVSPASPYCIYFRRARANVSGFFRSVSLRRYASTFFQVWVQLYPRSGFGTVLANVIARAFRVLGISIRYLHLSMSNAVSVVQRRPARQRVIVLMAIGRYANQRLVVVLFAIR